MNGPYNNASSISRKTETISTNGNSSSEQSTAFSSHSRAGMRPFSHFNHQVLTQDAMRKKITRAYRISETDSVIRLLPEAKFSSEQKDSIHALAYKITEKLRNRKIGFGRSSLVQNLLQEYSLSSEEGVALMCLAEALLRIPDTATRDALTRDKIALSNWRAHSGKTKSVFVNATAWGLILTGKIVQTADQDELSSLLDKLTERLGMPIVRRAMSTAMRIMGSQFVTGQTIQKALSNVRGKEKLGFRYSFDMLGEAALTEKDAQDYLLSYQQAIDAIGQASNGRGVYEGPGISIKLSALHPRYSRTQYDRVMDELYPRLLSLVTQARQYDIGINIDAEEADRLEISLDLLEKLCFEPQLAGWHGIGFVIQAYQKRCRDVVDYIIDLAKRSQHRLMVRLVKGAYWDSEIKRAQIDGLDGYPVFTQKVHTDMSYIACARALFSEPEWIYPQFATHNAQTLASVYHLAGKNYASDQYEFQCLYGMGEPLYDQVVGKSEEGKLNRPCRIYAPVGTHETLLAYLVRRLLENGANTSFVNQIASKDVAIEQLIDDPVDIIERSADTHGIVGRAHPKIPLPQALYGSCRKNSTGLDLSNEQQLAMLSTELNAHVDDVLYTEPKLAKSFKSTQPDAAKDIINPANHTDIVGQYRAANEEEITYALNTAEAAMQTWGKRLPDERAAYLEAAADLMQARMQSLIGVLVRESGKTFANAISEVREAIDFLNYYARQIKTTFDSTQYQPLGPVVCISPWNFPLAIFTGQIAAALAAGNSVLAKPAEQTPLIAGLAVDILHQAGIPKDALQLVPGKGSRIGSALTGDTRVQGVMFTGSTEVAKIIQRTLTSRLSATGREIPFIAETGGLNAMIVDSSALTEQVVTDVIASAFDSAGQRCSALRLLCVQGDVAERTLAMLKGSMKEYRLGNPDSLEIDIGPVIDASAMAGINAYIQMMRDNGKAVYQAAFQLEENYAHLTSQGNFIPPTLIELTDISELEREIFGPVLHVVRYRHDELPVILNKINASGYGLTFGIHTRIESRMEILSQKIHAGNVYVNRNVIGAVVGVQPFGGEGLSGTGPKAGGPLYLHRLLAHQPNDAVIRTLQQLDAVTPPDMQDHTQYKNLLDTYLNWLLTNHYAAIADQVGNYIHISQAGIVRTLVGPTGESNTYRLLPRGMILGLFSSENDALLQLGAALATGCTLYWEENDTAQHLFSQLPEHLRTYIQLTQSLQTTPPFSAVIIHGERDNWQIRNAQIAEHNTAIIPVIMLDEGDPNIPLHLLLHERAISINTAAAGGNTSLMTLN